MIERNMTVINRQGEAGYIADLIGMGAAKVRWFDGRVTLEAIDFMDDRRTPGGLHVLYLG